MIIDWSHVLYTFRLQPGDVSVDRFFRDELFGDDNIVKVCSVTMTRSVTEKKPFNGDNQFLDENVPR